MNRLEVEIDEQCIEFLALRQPAAGDLRLIITGLKISTDLERIGDLGVNLCERVLELLETDGHARVEAAHRVLEHHLQLAAHAPQSGGIVDVHRRSPPRDRPGRGPRATRASPRRCRKWDSFRPSRCVTRTN